MQKNTKAAIKKLIDRETSHQNLEFELLKIVEYM